jgi:iron(III) transport system substrate-binding protein
MIRARILSIGLFLMLAGMAAAADDVTRFGAADAPSELTIWSSTDLAELRPVIEDFLKANPAVAILHHDVQSAEIYDRIRKGQPAPPDLTISSAADLQVKLVNDGFALEHTLPGNIELPGWASWRSSAFGISMEPAVFVYHDSFRQFGALPSSRTELARTITANRAALDGRIATYDIEQSGLGYLFASQDSLYSNTYTILMHSLGAAHVRLYCCSGEMLDEIETGTALMGYNVLGSYALARKRAGAPIEIVLPEDYTLVLSRVALLPRGGKRPDLGGAFLDFLLSPDAQKRLANLGSYRPASTIISHPITLNPTLLVFLDPIKKARFIKAWKMLIRSAQDFGGRP